MERHRLALRSSQRGFFTLIGLLLALAIIAILLGMYGMPSGTGGSGAGQGGDVQTVVGGTKNRAMDAVCRNNLSQLRAAIGIHSATTQSYPSSLEQLNAGVDLVCPTGGEPYRYNPQTGKVTCAHPGHEGF